MKRKYCFFRIATALIFTVIIAISIKVDTVSATASLPPPNNIKCKVETGSVDVTWDSVAGSDGYVVYCTPKKKKKYQSQWKVVEGTFCSFSDLAANQTYYIEIATIDGEDGVYYNNIDEVIGSKSRKVKFKTKRTSFVVLLIEGFFFYLACIRPVLRLFSRS